MITLLFFSFSTVYTNHPEGNTGGAVPAQGSVPIKSPNAVVFTTSTVTTTVTRTVNVTTTPAGPRIAVHVVNQYGIWYEGAVVEVFFQTPGSSPATYNLVANGTTVHGVFYATGLVNFSTYMVSVFTPTGGSANSVVSVSDAGASLNFVIASPAPPTLALLDVSVSAGAAAGVLSVSANVVNTSNSTAYNAQLSISPPPQLSLLNTGSVLPIGILAPGASKPVTLPMTVVPSVTATTGYAVGYMINFSDFSGTGYGTSGAVSLPTPAIPSLIVQNVVLNPGIIQPGTYFSLTANVVNASNSTAYNTQLSISPPAQFSLLNTGSVIPLDILPPGASKQVTLAMTVSSAATTTGYNLAFTTTFTDYFLNKFSGFGNIFVPVTGNAVHPNLVITSVSFSSQAIHPGDTFSVPMSFQNIGPVPASEVILSVNATSPIAIVGSAGAYQLGTVVGNGNKSLTLRFTSPSSAQLGSYPITLVVSYLDNYGALYVNHQSLVATLIGEPTIVLNSLRFKNNPLTPGLQTFLSAQLNNVGGDSALNVKLSFQGGPGFLSNTTMYLGSIAPNGSGNGTAYLQVPNGIRVGDYTFSAVVSYSDPSGNSYNINSPYSVTVAPYSPPDVSVTNTLLSPAVVGPGALGTFTIYLKNDGANPARNVTVSLNDQGRIFSSSFFGLGTLDALASGTTVVGVNVDPSIKGGQYIVQIHVAYSDDTGSRYNSSTPIEITIYATSSPFSTTNIGIVAGIVVVAVLAFILLRKPRS